MDKSLFESSRHIEILELTSEVRKLAISRSELKIDDLVSRGASGVPANHGGSRHEDGELEVAIDLERRLGVDAVILELSDGVLERPLSVSDGLRETEEHGGDLVHVMGVVVTNHRGITTTSILSDAESGRSVKGGLSDSTGDGRGLLSSSSTTLAAQHRFDTVPDNLTRFQASLNHKVDLHALVGAAVTLHVDLVVEVHTSLEDLVLRQNRADVDNTKGAHREGRHGDQIGLEIEDGHDGITGRDRKRFTILGQLKSANLIVLRQMSSLESATTSIRTHVERQKNRIKYEGTNKTKEPHFTHVL